MRTVVLTLLVLALSACHRPPILERYGAKMPTFPDQCEGGLHPGVDFRASLGAPALASADGVVVSRRATETGGGVLLLWHEEFDRYTAYAHLRWTERTPSVGQRVRRGQVLGRVGMFRNSGGRPHLHLELCTTPCVWGHPECSLAGTEDPLGKSGSCFQAERQYSASELVLTYPVSC